MSDLSKVAALLDSERPEVQMAAALVLGEIEAKDVAALKGLCRLAQSRSEGLQLGALIALERIASLKALPTLLGALDGREAVRQAATRAIARLGEVAIPEVRSQLKGATGARAAHLTEVLAHMTGGKGITALLEGLYVQDLETALKNAVQVRHEVRGMDAKARHGLAGQLEKFLARSKTKQNEVATAASIRILGYLEDGDSTETLVRYATEKKQSSTVRIEALIALRFALGNRRDAPEVAKALLRLVLDADARLARAALDTLSNLVLPKSAIPILTQVALGPDPDRARAGILGLATLGADAASALVHVAIGATPVLAEEALRLLGGREEACAALLEALLTSKQPMQEGRLAQLLRPHARTFSEANRVALAKTARARLKQGRSGSEPLLALLREADPRRFAAVLRDEATRAGSERNTELARALLAFLCRTEEATDVDRFGLARYELDRSPVDFALHARRSDSALTLYAQLARRGAPVAEQIESDATLDAQRRFYIGFHLAELPEGEGREVGQEILAEIAKGRNKTAQLARNKLRISQGQVGLVAVP